MKLQTSLRKYTLQFRFDAGTSRGVMKTRDIWYLFIQNPNQPSQIGIGEIAPLPGLSKELDEGYEQWLMALTNEIAQTGSTNLNTYSPVLRKEITERPSAAFAIDTAFADYVNGGKRLIFDTAFYKGKQSIPINGLVWMGDFDFMEKQLEAKLEEGFNCIKIKVGAIDFNQECRLLEKIRKRFDASRIELRLDANGAFTQKDVFSKLKTLSEFEIHSIEQPVRQGQFELSREVCASGLIDVALDEELIGVFDIAEKQKLLEQIRPQYIILKPSLIGGFSAVQEWIEIAGGLGIGWWITSALESNIGLNAIAQLTSKYQPLELPQGLGTGKLYHNNPDSPLVIQKGSLSYDPALSWNLSSIS